MDDAVRASGPSDRTRALWVGAAAALVALGVLGVALATRSHVVARPVPLTAHPLGRRVPPLVYDLPGSLARRPGEGEAAYARRLAATADPRAALALASAALSRGDRVTAGRALDRAAAALGADDARVTVGRALLLYDPSNAQPALDRLEAIAADRGTDPLPLFEAGLVAFGGGDPRWQTLLRQARDSAPDGFYAWRADQVLHPDMLPRWPPWFPSQRLPQGTLSELQALARARPGSARDQLALAVALQAHRRRSEARAAAVRAAVDDPRNLDAQVAAAVLGFQKDDPAAAFGVLGPLRRDHPRAVAPPFHLGFLLLWIGARQRAAQEFRTAARIGAGTPLGRTAAAIASRLAP